MWTNLGHLITVILQQEDFHSCTGLDPRVPWSIVAGQVVVIMLFISIMIIITIMISSYPGYFEHSLQRGHVVVVVVVIVHAIVVVIVYLGYFEHSLLPGHGRLHHLELHGLLSSGRGSDNNNININNNNNNNNNVLQRII